MFWQSVADRYRDALIEADIYLASLGWWEIGNLAKVGEIIGEAIGWDKVAEINTQYATSESTLRTHLKGK